MRMNMKALTLNNWKPAGVALFGQAVINPIVMIILSIVFGMPKEATLMSLTIASSPGGVG